MTTATSLPFEMPPDRELRAHPYAELLPESRGPSREALRLSLTETGQQLPVVLYENRILDGRNRYEILRSLGQPVRCVDFLGGNDEALRFALTTNTARRQLNESQRALLAAKNRSELNLSQVGAAAAFGVSERLVRDAEYLASRTTNAAARDLYTRVFNGETTLKAAMRILRGEAATHRNRRILIEPHPDNARLQAMPGEVLDPELQRQVDATTRAFAAGAIDAASWVHGLTPEQAASLLPALDNFVRQAMALAIEEGLMPMPTPRTHGRRRAEPEPATNRAIEPPLT